MIVRHLPNCPFAARLQGGDKFCLEQPTSASQYFQSSTFDFNRKDILDQRCNLLHPGLRRSRIGIVGRRLTPRAGAICNAKVVVLHMIIGERRNGVDKELSATAALNGGQTIGGAHLLYVCISLCIFIGRNEWTRSTQGHCHCAANLGTNVRAQGIDESFRTDMWLSRRV